MSIAENIAAVRQQMDQAARETGRTGADIILVGASKMNDAAACQEAIAAGIDALGENRVQEMTAKLAENAYEGRPLHFIGHLQRNKVRQVVGKADLIQSVGSAGAAAGDRKGRRKTGALPGYPAGGEHRRRGRQKRLFPGSDPRCGGDGPGPAPCAGAGTDGHSPGGGGAPRKFGIFRENALVIC